MSKSLSGPVKNSYNRQTNKGLEFFFMVMGLMVMI